MTDEQMKAAEDTPPWMLALQAMMDNQTAEMRSALGVTSERIANLETIVLISHKNIEQRFNSAEGNIQSTKNDTKHQFEAIEQRLTKLEFGATGPAPPPRRQRGTVLYRMAPRPHRHRRMARGQRQGLEAPDR